MTKHEAALFVPFDRHERVFPWGPHFVKEYSERHVDGARVGLIDLAAHEPVKQAIAWQRFPGLVELMAALRRRLPAEARGDLFPPGPFYLQVLEDPETYAAGLLLLADRALVEELCALVGRRSLAAAREQAQLVDGFDAALRPLVDGVVDGERPLFGVSHFGRNLTSGLSTVAALRRLYPRAGLVLGGPHVNVELARTLTRSDLGLDAAVVGFGEKPFATLLARWRGGAPLDGAEVPFVVTRSRASIPGASAEHEYRFDAALGPFADDDYDAARVDALGNLHILPIRGCRWGACTFCADVFALKRYRAPVLGPADEKLARDIARGVREWIASGKASGRVFIDSAEVYGDEAIQTLTLVDQELRALGHRFADDVSVFFYIPARKFDLELARRFRAWAASTWHPFWLGPTVAIESLNRVSLANIKKGIDPLQAVTALKIAIDAGWPHAQAQFFLFYPGEERAAVEEEVALMRRSLHILAAKAIRFKTNLPLVTKESDLYQRPEGYGIAPRSVADPLLSLRFHEPVSPGATTWASQFRPVDGERYATPWFELVSAWYWLLGREQMMAGAGRVARAAARLSAGVQLARRGLRVAARALAGDRGLVERALLAWWCGARGNEWYRAHRGEERSHPILRIAGGWLEKDYPFPFAERWRRELATDELAVLRALYTPTARAEIVERLAAQVGRARLESIVEEQLRLGVLVAQDGRLVCLANDPEHAAAQPAVAVAPGLVPLRRAASRGANGAT
jgi:hypothetical protein